MSMFIVVNLITDCPVLLPSFSMRRDVFVTIFLVVPLFFYFSFIINLSRSLRGGRALIICPPGHTEI